MVVSSSSSFAFYNRVNGNYVYQNTISAGAGETDFKISKDGTYIVCDGGSNPALFKYNGTTFAKVSATFTNNMSDLRHTDISPDNAFVVGGGITFASASVYLNVFRMASDVPTNIISLSDSNTKVRAVKFSKTGKYLIVGLNTGLGLGTDSTAIYVKSSNTYVLSSTIPNVGTNAVDFFNNDSKMVTYSATNNTISIYDVNTTTNVFTLVKSHILSGSTILDLKISPNNKYLMTNAFSSNNASTAIYRLKSDNELVKCYKALPFKSYTYQTGEFIDNNSVLFMGDLNTGPVFVNGFVYENFTNPTNRLPLIKG